MIWESERRTYSRSSRRPRINCWIAVGIYVSEKSEEHACMLWIKKLATTPAGPRRTVNQYVRRGANLDPISMYIYMELALIFSMYVRGAGIEGDRAMELATRS